MSALIVYASKYGTTQRCALELRDRLGGGAQVMDLRGAGGAGRKELERALDVAGVVVVGGSIYAGRIRPEVPRFCERYREKLLGRKVALFICCLETGDRAREELAAGYPEWLSSHAFERAILGGEVRLGALRPLDRFLFTRLGKVTVDVSRIDHGAIGALAAKIDVF